MVEHFQTDTADFADLLLPATTFLEHDDLYLLTVITTYNWLVLLCLAPGETRSNVEIFRALAQAMGFDEPCFRESGEEMIRGLLDSGSPYLQGITLERLDREKWVRLNVSSLKEPFLPFATGSFKTASGKFEFGAESLEYTVSARISSRRSGTQAPISVRTDHKQERQ